MTFEVARAIVLEKYGKAVGTSFLLLEQKSLSLYFEV